MEKCERIKSRRIELDMTLQDVADKMGISRQTVYKYENGIITNIPYDSIVGLAKALNASPAYLMGWDDKIAYVDTPLDLTKNFTIDKNGDVNYKAKKPVFPTDWPNEMIDKINEYIELLKPKYNVD